MCTLSDQRNPTTTHSSGEKLAPSSQLVEWYTKPCEQHGRALERSNTAFPIYMCWKAEILDAKDSPQQFRLKGQPFQAHQSFSRLNQSLLICTQETLLSLPMPTALSQSSHPGPPRLQETSQRHRATVAQTWTFWEGLAGLKDITQRDTTGSKEHYRSIALVCVLPRQQEMGQNSKRMDVPKGSQSSRYLRYLAADGPSTSDTCRI